MVQLQGEKRLQQPKGKLDSLLQAEQLTQNKNNKFHYPTKAIHWPWSQPSTITSHVLTLWDDYWQRGNHSPALRPQLNDITESGGKKSPPCAVNCRALTKHPHWESLTTVTSPLFLCSSPGPITALFCLMFSLCWEKAWRGKEKREI